jgi:pilus assembly protein CpaE
VLNRADDKVGLSADQVESTLDMRIAASVPTSSQVAHATNSGEPIIIAHPRHPVSQAIARFAVTLAGPPANGEHRAGSPAGTPKRSLLRRNGR